MADRLHGVECLLRLELKAAEAAWQQRSEEPGVGELGGELGRQGALAFEFRDAGPNGRGQVAGGLDDVHRTIITGKCRLVAVGSESLDPVAAACPDQQASEGVDLALQAWA